MVSVESLRCEHFAPRTDDDVPTPGGGGGVLVRLGIPPLLIEPDWQERQAAADGPTPQSGRPAMFCLRSIPVEGESHRALPPNVGLSEPNPGSVSSSVNPVACNPIACRPIDRVRHLTGGPVAMIGPRWRSLQGRISAPPPATRAPAQTDRMAASVSGCGPLSPPPALQPGRVGSADGLPSDPHARIAARKAGYAQRNADERPPAGGKPHRHR
jgi:hypothetical protein